MATASLAQGKIGLGRALLALAAAGLLLGIVVVLTLATSAHAELRGWEAAVAVLIGWGFIGAGLYAWWRRPANNFGPLMTATGFLFFVSELAASDHTLVFTLATLGGNLFLAVVVHMLLAMPSGRLRTRGERALVVAAYVFASPLSRIYVLLADPQDFGCEGCPESALLITDDTDLAHDVDTVINVTAFLVFGLTLVFLWRKWRRASRTERHALGPVVLSGATAMAVLEVGLIGQLSGHATIAEIGYYATQAAILPLPYAFLASLARSRVMRGDVVSELVTHLGRAPAQGEIRDALARALDDPSLQLAYWLPEFGSYADVEGHPVELADSKGDRAATPVSRNGEPVAALVHDAALLDERGLLDAVAGAAAIALENARLNVELRARLEELRGSRARIVEAGDAERRRLERNLHDGAQQRLVGVALQLRLLQNRVRGDAAAEELIVTAATELQASLQELRELARGLHPAVLEHGLAAALQTLATRSAVETTVSYDADGRLPDPVELAAYFVASESLTNVAKYSHATHATVRVSRADSHARIEIADDGIGGADGSRGSGLRGLADRVEALDGTLHVTSPPGAGTTVTAELPCGS
jgi:signal transduction histidine kinase